MAAMPLKDYEEYIRTGLLFVDHHDVLRSAPAGYSLATTQAQVKALIRYLEEIAPSVGAEA